MLIDHFHAKHSVSVFLAELCSLKHRKASEIHIYKTLHYTPLHKHQLQRGPSRLQSNLPGTCYIAFSRASHPSGISHRESFGSPYLKIRHRMEQQNQINAISGHVVTT